MSTPAFTLDDRPLPVQAKIAAAWTTFMFLYAYVDILGMYRPGVVRDILDGRVHTFDITQTFGIAALVSVSIPAFMVTVSMLLPARANRLTQLVVAVVLIPYSAFNVAGGEWFLFYGLGVVLEVVLLALIIRWAWSWPQASAAQQSSAPIRAQRNA